MMNSPTQLLQIQDLTLYFRALKGVVRAVDGVDFELSTNRAVVILGESGCGKSTLLRLIAGLDAPDEGAVRIDGRDAYGCHPPGRPGEGGR